ncbi:MAG: methylmalonyl-CoA epimerase [Alphaproteobacteria bacterium]|nr:methylmalonyl-CoA epimerase [Alphaproteobacteria bacterium]
MIIGFSHVSIAVPDLEAAAKQLEARYGLKAGPVMVNAEQGVRLAYVEVGAARIELMQPTRPDTPVGKFLERNPKGGIHHFSLAVDDMNAATQSLRENGVRVLGDGRPQLNVAGERIAFVHPADFLGALVELEEHKPPSKPR